MRFLKGATLAAVIATGVFANASEAAVLYSNGPADGQTNSWFLGPGFAVANSFTLDAAYGLTGATFSSWMDPNDTVTDVEWTILNGMPGTGTVLRSGTSSATNSSAMVNSDGWWVRTVSFALPDINLGAGTYWLELDNAITASGDPVTWDINGGPSSAWQVSFGDVTNCPGGIPAANNRCSATFDILGDPQPVTAPEPNSIFLLAGALGLFGFGFSFHTQRRHLLAGNGKRTSAGFRRRLLGHRWWTFAGLE